MTILNSNHAKTLQSLEGELKLALCLLDKNNPKHNEEAFKWYKKFLKMAMNQLLTIYDYAT